MGERIDWEHIEELRRLYWAPGGPKVSMASIFRELGLDMETEMDAVIAEMEAHPTLKTTYAGYTFEGVAARNAIEKLQASDEADRIIREHQRRDR